MPGSQFGKARKDDQRRRPSDPAAPADRPRDGARTALLQRPGQPADEEASLIEYAEELLADLG